MDNSYGIIHIAAEGRAEGVTQGKTEAKMEVARNLQRAGLSLSQIAAFTGITEQEIEKLKKNDKQTKKDP